MKTKWQAGWQAIVIGGLLSCMVGVWTACGQEALSSTGPAMAGDTNLVTLSVDNGPIAQVLNAFSRQTGRSIVIGPEVVANVTLRITDKPWQDALDVMLKPYGFGYYMVGDTIIICGLDKMAKPVVPVSAPTPGPGTPAPAAPAPKPPEPMVMKVLTLKYLDAMDVEALLTAQKSPAGTIGRLLTRSQSWQDQQIYQGSLNTTSSESLGRLKRMQEDVLQVRGKTLVVVDTQAVVNRIEAILAEVDKPPIQVQIEAKFVEVRADLLRDIGVEWGSGVGGASTPGVMTLGTKGASSLYAAGGQQINGTVKPDSFNPQSVNLSGTRPFNGGLSLAFQKLTDLQFEVLLHVLQEDSSYNMLSAPRVLTLDNQDAVIIVGQKLPIIKSETSGAVGTTTISTTLERYEDVGIKLKVLPQVCDLNSINLIVHPSVRELLGYQSGKVGSGSDTGGGSVSLTEYPVIATREAETQVLIKSGQTIVIGGMMRDRKQTTTIKVPFLGSIPWLGALFRRETVDTEKVELLIFLTAAVRTTSDDMAVQSPDVKHLIPAPKPEDSKTKKP